MSKIVRIESDSLQAEFTQRGGAVLRLALKRQGNLLQLFRPVDDSPISGRKGAICPMPWYLGRIENKLLPIPGGAAVTINHDEDHALHARTPHVDWEIVAQKDNSVELFVSDAQLKHYGDPISYESKVRYVVQGNTLRMEMAVKAVGCAGYFIPGIHPYLLKTLAGPEDSFLFNAWITSRYEKEEGDIFPRKWHSPLAREDYQQSLAVLPTGLDHTNDGWNHAASFYYPKTKLLVQMKAGSSNSACLPRLHLWNPDSGNVWGAEPILGVPGGWNLKAPNGEAPAAVLLNDGEEITLSMDLQYLDLAGR